METHPLSDLSSLNTAPLTVPLTVWEAKERAGLLAIENDEWRQKRLIAEDPNTTADVLKRISEETIAFCETAVTNYMVQMGCLTGSSPRRLVRQQSQPATYVHSLLLQALAAHPNMPPEAILHLMRFVRKLSPLSGRNAPLPSVCPGGLCGNPVSPLIVLEAPDFWHRLDIEICQLLLCQESLPAQVAATFSHHAASFVVEAARLHISVAGKIQTQNEGQAALGQFWETSRSKQSMSIKRLRERSKSAEILVVPTWILRAWMERLKVAVALPLSDKPFPDDLWSRSPLELMHHLARDGNRLVRWAAQTRLADPDFTFTWHDEEKN